MTQDFKKGILFGCIFSAFVAFNCWVFIQLWDTHEVEECRTWQEQKEEYSDRGWYATGWQVEQCKAHGINL